jgi:hypothetical protein
VEAADRPRPDRQQPRRSYALSWPLLTKGRQYYVSVMISRINKQLAEQGWKISSSGLPPGIAGPQGGAIGLFDYNSLRGPFVRPRPNIDPTTTWNAICRRFPARVSRSNR